MRCLKNRAATISGSGAGSFQGALACLSADEARQPEDQTWESQEEPDGRGICQEEGEDAFEHIAKRYVWSDR